MAADSLGGFFPEGKPAVPDLIVCLEDPAVEVRRSAVLSLGKLGKGDPKVEEGLEKVKQDPDPTVRMNLAIAEAGLGKTDDGTIPELFKALGSKQEPTAKAAAKVLGELGAAKSAQVLPHLMEGLDKEGDPAAINTVRVLRHMKGYAVPALPKLAALYDKADQPTRIEIIDALVAIDRTGDHAIPVLTKALGSSSPKDRKEALITLMRYRSQVGRVIDGIMEAFHDPDVDNRELAVSMIKGFGPEGLKAVPELIKLADDGEFKVRRAALAALAAFTPPPPETLQTFEKALGDPDHRIRSAAVGALRKIGYLHPDRVKAILESALKVEQHEQTKSAITSTLQRMNTKPSEDPGVKREERPAQGTGAPSGG